MTSHPVDLGAAGQPAVDAVVVVDVQQAFVRGVHAVPAAQALLAAAEGLLARARAAGVPVVLVQNDGAPGTPDEPGAPGWELAVSRAHRDIVIRKTDDDAFDGTSLEAVLRDHHAGTVAVAGLYSEMCVAATARGAMARGFVVVLPHDAHATQATPAWEGVADEVPAAAVRRVVEWSLGDQIVLVPRAADVCFRGELHDHVSSSVP